MKKKSSYGVPVSQMGTNGEEHSAGSWLMKTSVASLHHLLAQATFLETFSDLEAFYNKLILDLFHTFLFCSRNVQITCPLSRASVNHKIFPQKWTKPYLLQLIFSKWAESCSQPSKQKQFLVNIFLVCSTTLQDKGFSLKS